MHPDPRRSNGVPAAVPDGRPSTSAGGPAESSAAPPQMKMPPPRQSPGLKSRLKTAAARALPRSVFVDHGAGGARRVALTFDDGPDDMTHAYLDVLERHQARATFFVVGQACRGREAILRQVSDRGHELAGHGFTHRPFPKLGVTTLLDELNQTAAMLPRPRAGTKPLVRPPYGATSVRSLAVCAAAGFTTVMWSRDSDDCRTTTPEVVAARVVPGDLQPGEIVLLHEGQAWTLAALEQILVALAAHGWQAVTISEIIGSTGR
jgi:peptidoglycan-N-acetylglucosamine deacetylase